MVRSLSSIYQSFSSTHQTLVQLAWWLLDEAARWMLAISNTFDNSSIIRLLRQALIKHSPSTYQALV